MVAAFEKQKTTAEIAEILKTLYHGGNGLGSVSAWYAEDGIHLSHGKSVRYDRSAQVVSWEGAAESPLNLMYRQLAKMSHEDTILAVIMDKKQKPEANGWLRLEKQQLGKRKFEIYRCLNN